MVSKITNLEGDFALAATEAILGRKVMFDAPALRTIAQWAGKTALMLQDHLEDLGNVTHRARGHLAALPLGPPSGTEVWLGAYGPRTRFVFWQGVPMSLPGPDGRPTEEHVGYATLITVGHLVLVILAIDAEQGNTEAAGLLPIAFHQAWPIPEHLLAWPDGLVLNDLGIARLWPPPLLGDSHRLRTCVYRAALGVRASEGTRRRPSHRVTAVESP